MCNTHNKEEKEKRIRTTAETLFRRRYEGIIDSEPLYPTFIEDDGHYENECEKEYGNFTANFIGNIPRQREIWFTENLLSELEEMEKETNVEISTIVNCYLLQMLERNKRTTELTKARRVYVKNSLYETSAYIQKCESKEEFEKNIFDKEIIKHKELSYKNMSLDEEIYIKNFLLDKGYTLDQIHQIEKEEKEIQGTFNSPEGEVMKPITLHMEMICKEVPAFNHDYDVHLFVSARLGLHYILLNEVETLNNYEDIEVFLNSKLKGDKKVWNLYAKYLEKNLI